MKKNFVYVFLSAFLLTSMTACVESGVRTAKTEVRLQSPFRNFDTTEAGRSRLSSAETTADLDLPDDLTAGFTIRFSAKTALPGEEEVLLEIPQVLKVCLRRHDPNEWLPQNYPAYKMPDGSVPVMEASLSLQSLHDSDKFQDLVVGLPLALLDKPEGNHDVVLQFTGVQWSLYVDGRLYDNDFALGYPSAGRMKSWRLNPDYVSEAALYTPALRPEKEEPAAPLSDANIQYWTPPFHNAWVGDVVTFYHEGRYHVFYLFDRRGHASKFGKGGHYFEHLSTTDFRTWTEHEAATPLEHQWETFGTGTPFVFGGKLCLSYGLHTTRIYPEEQTTLPMQWEYLKKNGCTGSFDYDTIRGLVPAGSTYSVCEDGVSKFRKTHVLYHPCENPSIYTDAEGKLKMLANYGARGTWGSDSVAGGWRCLDADFPPGGDCTFFFHWGDYDYILGGFTRMWSKPAAEPDSAYRDLVAEGMDFYNGLSVPAVSEVADGRFLMAGWVKMQNWGGALVIHELVQHADGYVGTKWMEEITPATDEPQTLSDELSGTGGFEAPQRSFMLTFEVCPGQPRRGTVGVSFLPASGDGDACEWQLRLDDVRAQYAAYENDGFADVQKTLSEGGDPQSARNYAIRHGMDTGKPFTVRMIVDGNNKFGGSLIDTEIDARRTMLSYRPRLSVGRLLFRTDGVQVRNIRIAPLCD